MQGFSWRRKCGEVRGRRGNSARTDAGSCRRGPSNDSFLCLLFAILIQMSFLGVVEKALMRCVNRAACVPDPRRTRRELWHFSGITRGTSPSPAGPSGKSSRIVNAESDSGERNPISRRGSGRLTGHNPRNLQIEEVPRCFVVDRETGSLRTFATASVLLLPGGVAREALVEQNSLGPLIGRC